MNKTKMTIAFLATAFLVSFTFMCISMHQTQVALDCYNELLNNYSELKDAQDYLLDEASEQGYEAGFNIGYFESADTWLSGLQQITIDEDGITIRLTDKKGEEWIVYADESRG